MITLLLSFLLLLISLYLLSFPYQILLNRYISFDYLPLLISSMMLFLSMLAFSGSYIWQLNLSNGYFYLFLLLHTLFSLACIFLNPDFFFEPLIKLRIFVLNNVTLILGLCFVFFLISLPSIISFLDFSMPQRYGPDANGPLAAANYIRNGGTLGDLTSYNLTNLGTQNLDEIFNLTKIYELNSLNKQIISEFSLGSLRFTFPYLLVSLKTLLFWLSFFQIATITAALATFIICCSSIAILRNRSKSIQSLGLLSSATSPIFLNLWYEGSYPQVFSVAFLITIFMILQCRSPKNARFLYILATLFLFSAILIYPDTFFILILILFPCLVFFGIKKPKLLLRYGLVLTFSFLALQLQFVLKFLDWLSRRLKDASQGGWPQPFWPDYFSYLGIANPFLNYTPYEQTQTNLQVTMSVISNIILFVFLVYLIKLKSPINFVIISKYFLLSTFTMLTLFQILSRLVLGDSNYQILKITGTLSPLLIILSIYILEYVDLNYKNFVYMFSLSFILMSLFARGSYLYDFLDSPHNVNSRLNSTEKFSNQNLLSNSNILLPTNFGTGGLEIWNLAVYFEINHVNRSASNYDRYFEDVFDVEKPIVILFDNNSCIEFKCSSFEFSPMKKNIYGDLMALTFAPNSDLFEGVKIGEISKLLFNSIDGLAYKESSY